MLPDSSFCEVCGESLSVGPVPPVQSGYKKCPKCGSLLLPDSVFCEVCGERLDSEPPKVEEGEDDPTMLTQLVTISAEEARRGCDKTIRTRKGDTVNIKVPPYTKPDTYVDVDGYGLPDGRGGRGKLRVTFFVAG